MSVNAARVQCCRGADDDEQADHVRVTHPDIGIEAHPPNLHWRLLGGCERRVRAGSTRSSSASCEACQKKQ